MDDPYDWTRQKMLQEIEALRAKVDRLKSVESKHKKLKKKHKALKRSVIEINLKTMSILGKL